MRRLPAPEALEPADRALTTFDAMSPHAALRHDAFVHGSEEEYVTRSVAFLKDGLDAGEACMVANTRDRIAAMRDALGSDAGRVTFVDVAETYTRPARAVAAYYRAFRDQLRSAASVRAVASFQLGPTAADWEAWAGYEAVTNLAYAHLPVWVVCAYDGNGLPDRILDDVWRTHADMLGDGWRESDRFQDPRAVIRERAPEPKPLGNLRSLPVANDLESFREQLARELVAHGVPEGKALDMLVAGSEVAANAMCHGGGIEEVRVGRADGRFVCEIVDRGDGFEDPVAGYIVPREGTGAGLWVARQLTWDLEAFMAQRGFTVRVWL
jgi:anti-sigma regulatory factor (Ser/Thr protein kinase)